MCEACGRSGGNGQSRLLGHGGVFEIKRLITQQIIGLN